VYQARIAVKDVETQTKEAENIMTEAKIHVKKMTNVALKRKNTPNRIAERVVKKLI